MRTIPSIRWLLAPLAVALAVQFPSTPLAQVVIAGNDNKALVVDGKLQIDPQGVQSVSIIDIGPDGPTLRATVKVPNSIFGPPTNLAVTADNRLALVAEAVRIDPDASPPKFMPSDKLHVIDLEANPPRVIDTLTVGRQPSGMAISPDGRLAIVANRAETSVSVLSIAGKQVRFEGTVETGDQVTHVAFTPDGKRAMINKASTDQVSFLAIDGAEVTLAGPDLAVGDYPYNADITPDGRLGIVANTGNNGRSDGNIDSITVIDLQHNPPRVIDHLAAGDAPEGITISPDSRLAVTGNLCGSDAPPDAWFLRSPGCIQVFEISDSGVRHVAELPAGGVPEALAFSPDGRWLLVANLLDADVSVFKVQDGQIVDTGRKLALPGHPGSMRATTP
jgi:DNA-binding beta-propeller fold protein YncE